jgi:L-lactate utilization protein LutC
MTKKEKDTFVEIYKLVQVFSEKYETLNKDELEKKILEHIKKYPKDNIMSFSTLDFMDIVDTVYKSKKI